MKGAKLGPLKTGKARSTRWGLCLPNGIDVPIATIFRKDTSTPFKRGALARTNNKGEAISAELNEDWVKSTSLMAMKRSVKS